MCDNGPGVAAHIAPSLFDPFCSSKDNGTGLGLAMSRTIVARHGGTLKYEPNHPTGACFTVRLPSQMYLNWGSDEKHQTASTDGFHRGRRRGRAKLAAATREVRGAPRLHRKLRPGIPESYDSAHPGCLVLDVRMPGMSGIELQQQLNLRGAVIPVIFITGHGDIPMAVEAMQQGAFDFLQKPFRDQDLIDRIQRALEKDRASRDELTQRSRIRERRETLTPREREVLDLVTAGKPNKIMAADLGLSQRTVEIHRARVMEKMGASSLAQLVRMTLDLQEPSLKLRQIRLAKSLSS